MSYCQIDHLITVPQGQLALRQQGAENAPDVLVLGVYQVVVKFIRLLARVGGKA